MNWLREACTERKIRRLLSFICQISAGKYTENVNLKNANRILGKAINTFEKKKESKLKYVFIFINKFLSKFQTLNKKNNKY